LRGRAHWRGRRNRQGDPGGPSFRPVFRRKILVGLHVEIALIAFRDRKDETHLRTDAEDAALEGAERRAWAAVAGELLKVIAGRADEKVLADELRRAPIEMKIYAVLILQIAIHQTVGHATNDREFMPGLRIEIGVAYTSVEGRETQTEIGEPVRIVGAVGNVA